jgi:HK97 family phage major capsid protein
MSLIKHTSTVHVEENSFVADDATATITFPEGQVVTDDSDQRNGTRYDIDSMQIEFNGSVTADHAGTLSSIIAKTSLFKRGRQVVMNAIQFAVNENPYAQIAYDLYKGGYAKDFSIETYGPWPDENGLIVNSKLSGLSGVVTGNNKTATVNSIVQNSLATARKNGLDTKEAEKTFAVEDDEGKKPKEADQQTNNKKENEMKFVTIKNSRDFAVKVKYKNASDEEVETELAPGAGVDVAEEQKDAVEKQVTDAKAPEAPKKEENQNQAADVNALSVSVNKMSEEFASFKKNMLDEAAKEPVFKLNNGNRATRRNGVKASELEKMDWRERTALQIQSLHSSFKGNTDAAAVANAINAFHLEDLQGAGLASNALDLPDIGNFVIPKEMVREIKEQPSNYQPILDLFHFDETMSLETAMIKGTGEIEMQDVEMNDNGDDTDLKPVSTPTFDTDNQFLKEFAAVTPVKASAIRFAAVDLVGHLTKLYKRAYDRKLAQSVIGRLQLAVDGNGHAVPYDYSAGSVEALISLIEAWSEVAEHTPGGVYTLTMKSYLHLMAMALRSGTNGPLATIFTKGPGEIPLFLSRPYAIAPSDLMPNLNSTATKSWSFEGQNVTVNSGVLYADPADFNGKVSGGLNFQVSDVASYEQGNTVKSSFQRDELVFRGYGYRSSGLYFEENVSAVTSPGIS